MKWLNVKKTKPSPNTKVLIYDKLLGIKVDIFSEKWNDWLDSQSGDVTHWMPLPPKPPKIK